MAKPKLPTPEKKLPEWARSCFKEYLDAHSTFIEIARLAETGIMMHTAIPNAVRVLAKIGADGLPDNEEERRRLMRANQDAEFAKSEIDAGFPLLRGFFVVAIWSWMEDFTKGLVASWFIHQPSSINSPAVSKIKFRVGDYHTLTRTERAYFLVDALEHEQASALKRGLSRFNNLLEAIGLNCPLPEESRKILYELQQVRNNLAHRNGKCDRKLSMECPWLKLRVGERVTLSSDMMEAYMGVASEFLLLLLWEVGDRFGVDLRAQNRATAAKSEAV